MRYPFFTYSLILPHNAKKQYGVEIVWRRDNSMPSHGEYSVQDWGVFARDKAIEFLAEQ